MKTANLLKTCGSTLVAATIISATTFGPGWAGEFKVACPDRVISSLNAEDIKASVREANDDPLTLMLLPVAEKYLLPYRDQGLKVNEKVVQLLQEGPGNGNFFKDF